MQVQDVKTYGPDFTETKCSRFNLKVRTSLATLLLLR